jgi:uncharacterized protein (TIGR02246 family)
VLYIPDSLKKQHYKWIDIVNNGDIDAYVNLLTENAVWIPPGQQPIIGRRAFKQWLAPFLGKYSYEFSITDERIKVAGDWALERGKFTSEMTPNSGGKSMKHSGSFTVLWKRGKDKEWYIDRYIDDSDL